MIHYTQLQSDLTMENNVENNEIETHPDWRNCKRDEALIIEQHYREVQQQVRLQLNEVAVMLEMLAELGIL